jgi:hypothetical protein
MRKPGKICIPQGTDQMGAKIGPGMGSCFVFTGFFPYAFLRNAFFTE